MEFSNAHICPHAFPAQQFLPQIELMMAQKHQMHELCFFTCIPSLVSRQSA